MNKCKNVRTMYLNLKLMNQKYEYRDYLQPFHVQKHVYKMCIH